MQAYVLSRLQTGICWTNRVCKQPCCHTAANLQIIINTFICLTVISLCKLLVEYKDAFILLVNASNWCDTESRSCLPNNERVCPRSVRIYMTNYRDPSGQHIGSYWSSITYSNAICCRRSVSEMFMKMYCPTDSNGLSIFEYYVE